MKKNNLKCLFAFLTAVSVAPALFLSCASVDMRSKVKPQTKQKIKEVKPQSKQNARDAEPIALPVRVIIEKPVYIPADDKKTDPKKGVDAVKKSNDAGTVKPQDYEHAAMVYDYDIDCVYEVYCQPLRVTDIRLAPGETALEPPYISDSERWMLGGGISHENGAEVQHIYIKPKMPSCTASLIINTDEREYHILLRSYSDVYMPIVRFRYHNSALPQFWLGAAAENMTKDNTATPNASDDAPLADARFVSFNYRVTYNFFKKPSWLPNLVYDDGKRTYITLPKGILQTELPMLFENREDIVNFRVVENVIVIDKLITSLTMKMDKISIAIQKLRGK